MRPTRSRRLAFRGSMVLSVALLATMGVAALPATAHAQFPSYIPMTQADTPSGVAVDKVGNVFVSVRTGGHGMIWKYTPDGIATFFADIGVATIYGLYAAANGDLYAAMAGGPDQGVYRLDRTGHAELLPGSEHIGFPNGFAFDDRGNLYVTGSNTGAPGAYGQGGIWRIPPKGRGEAKVWLRHELLTGIGILGAPPAPIGANGIAYFHGDLFVTNTDKGIVLRIPIEKDATPGTIKTWTTLGDVPQSPLAGSKFPIMPDGLVCDVHGNLYTTVLTRNAVISLSAADKTQQTVAVLGSTDPLVPSALFDTPASLAFGTGAGEQQNLFVTSLGWMVKFIPNPPQPWPGPALVKVHVGVPGRPLQ